MTILSETSANEPFLSNNATNPAFFGAKTAASGGTTEILTVIPAPIIQSVTVYPAPVVQEGQVVEFPPYTEAVTIQPPPKQVTIHTDSVVTLTNLFSSVGIINPGAQIRLCALVGAKIIAGARHYNNPPYSPYVGLIVRFIGDGGAIQEAKIVKVAFTRDDFECYELDQIITVVKPCAIASLVSNSNYQNAEVIVFGLLGTTKPAASKTVLKYAFASGAGWLATAGNKPGSPLTIQPGDSGSPVFAYNNGVPLYFGSISTINLTAFNINMAAPHAAALAAL